MSGQGGHAVVWDIKGQAGNSRGERKANVW